MAMLQWRTVAKAVACAFMLAPIPFLSAQSSPVQQGFELSEGFTLGPLGSTGGWSGLDVDVVDSTSLEGTYSLELADRLRIPALEFNLSSEFAADITFVDFYLTPVAMPQSALPGVSSIGVAASSALVAPLGASTGTVYAMDGSAVVAEWLDTGHEIALSNGRSTGWVRYTFRLDYVQRRWDLYVDGQMAAWDLGFLDTALTGFQHFTLQGLHEDGIFFDLFTVAGSNPLFPDADGDGLSDDYEFIEGLNENVNDRYLDADADGLTNIKEYGLGLKAGDPDSDGDGIDDGFEEFFGSDPLVVDSVTLTHLPFEEDFESFMGSDPTVAQNWSVQGAQLPEVQSSLVFGGSKALRFPGPSVLSNLVSGNGATVVWTDFQLNPVPWEVGTSEPEVDAYSASNFYFRSDGVVRAWDGLAGDWTSTRTLYGVGDWRRVTVRQDFDQQTWSLWVDGFPVAEDLGFANPVPFFRRFQISHENVAPAALDDISINAAQPSGLITDTDMDGLPDDWETTYFGNLAQDVLGDPDYDGLTNIQEYLNDSSPLFPESLVGEPALPFSDGFEEAISSPGARWNISGGGTAAIDEADPAEGAKALVLQVSGEGETVAAEADAHGWGEDSVWVDFQVRPTFDDVPQALDANTAAGLYFDREGYLRAYDGTSAEWIQLPQSPRPVNLAPVSPGAWVRLTVHLDYTAQTWSVWMNGVRAASNLGFAGSAQYFRKFAVSNESTTGLDSIYVGLDTPAGLSEPLPDMEAPSVPGGLTLERVGVSVVKISWAASTDNVEVAEYRVFRDGVFLGATSGTYYTDLSVVSGATYAYTVQAVDTWENVSSLSGALAASTPSLLQTGTGLKGEYFDRLYFQDPVLERLDAQINFTWASGTSPGPAVHSSTFCVRWTGLVEPEFTGVHSFQTEANDGVRVWVNGQLVIDNWMSQDTSESIGEILLTAGDLVPVVVEYFQVTGAGEIRLQWQTPDETAYVPVPTEALYPAPPVEPSQAPAAPTTPALVEAGDNFLTLSWNAGDSAPVAKWHVFVNGDQVGISYVPQFSIEGLDPDTSHDIYVKAEDYHANISANGATATLSTLPTLLPAPWRHIGVGPTPTRGAAGYNAGPDQFIVTSTGRDLFTHAPANQPDEAHFVYQPVEGDFSLVARLDSMETQQIWAKAGLMIREGLGGHDLHFSATISTGANAQLIARTASGTGTWNADTQVLPRPFWIRLQRVGNTFSGAYSPDGVGWQTIGSRYIPMNQEVYVGMAVCGHHYSMPTSATFSEVSLVEGVEQNQGGITSGVDSNGNGIADWEEELFYQTDPNVLDLSIAATVTSLNGAQGTAVFGSWATEGTALVSTSVKAAAEFNVTVTEPGIYRVRFELTEGHNETENFVHPVSVWVDGVLAARFNVFLDGEMSAFIHAPTHWLAAGAHTVRLRYDNVATHRSLKIIGMELQSLDGIDADTDGVADWMANLVTATNGLNAGQGESLISPACVEGLGRHRLLLEILADSQSIEPQPAPGISWYANVPLSADSPTEITATFENGAFEDSAQLVWRPLNVMHDASSYTQEILRIRKGDSLLLTTEIDWEIPGNIMELLQQVRAGTYSAGEGPWNDPENPYSAHALAWLNADISVTIEKNEETEAFLETVPGSPEPHEFAEAGLYSITAVYDDGVNPPVTTLMDVEVVEGVFNGDPVASWHPAITWDNPLISDDVYVVADQGLLLQDLGALPGGGTRFKLQNNNLNESYVLARTNENGPILDHAKVYRLDAASNTATSVDLMDTYLDGSKLISTPLILSHIDENTRVEVEIFVGGVTFEDGSIYKVFTAADFDEYGRLILRFIRGAGVTTSYCHRIHVYDGNTYLGTF